VRILYFAWVREAIGVGEEELALPADVVTVAELVTWLAARSPGHGTAFADPARLRAAVDGVFTGLDARIDGAREVALFPPVTGG
jgi:molybdopterin synthase sulfur carrier subunit